MFEKSAPGPFPFEMIGTIFITVDNPWDNPMAWVSTQFLLPNTDQVALTAGILVEGDYVYIVGQNMSNNGAATLSRIALAGLPTPQLEWWLGGLSWGVFQQNLGVLWPGPTASEGTLSYQPNLKAYYSLALSFIGTQISILLAPEITGPYQEISLFDIPPPWNNTTAMFCYAVKAHPELASYDEIVFSFVCNTFGLTSAIVEDLYIYQPQFFSANVSSLRAFLELGRTETKAASSSILPG